MTPKQITDIICRSGIEGTSGDCGAAAMAINSVLFDGKGEYVAAVPKDEDLASSQAFIDHVAVLHDGKLYDFDGVIPKKALKRYSDQPVDIVNLSEAIGSNEEVERVLRNSLRPSESYAEKKAALSDHFSWALNVSRIR